MDWWTDLPLAGRCKTPAAHRGFRCFICLEGVPFLWYCFFVFTISVVDAFVQDAAENRRAIPGDGCQDDAVGADFRYRETRRASPVRNGLQVSAISIEVGPSRTIQYTGRAAGS